MGMICACRWNITVAKSNTVIQDVFISDKYSEPLVEMIGKY